MSIELKFVLTTSLTIELIGKEDPCPREFLVKTWMGNVTGHEEYIFYSPYPVFIHI